jgi:hypothetical protein
MNPLDTSIIEARLKAEVPALDTVAGMVEYSQIKDLSGFRPGSAYVLLASERNPAAGTPQPRKATPAQATFGVVVVAQNYRDQLGKAALDDISGIVGAVREALNGWMLEGWTPIVWVQGDAAQSDASRAVWIDVFTTTHVLRG